MYKFVGLNDEYYLPYSLTQNLPGNIC